MTEVTHSPKAFKITRIDLDGKLYHLYGSGTERLSIPQELYDTWQPRIGGWIDKEPGVTGAVFYREAEKGIDFTRLNRLMEYSETSNDPGALNLLQSFRVFTQRYGSAYVAVLLQNADHEEDAYFNLANSYGFEKHLQARPWFPYRTARNAPEAIAQLFEFINNELTTDRTKLINWSVNCAKMEYILAKGDDSDYDFDPDWKLTLEESYT